MNLTRAQKILLIITIVVVVGALVFWLIVKKGISPVVPVVAPPTGGTTQTGLPTVGTGPSGKVVEIPGTFPLTTTPTTPGTKDKVQSLVNEPVRDIHLGANGSVYFYKPSDGNFYRLTAGGTPEKVTDKTLLGAQSITWSEGRDRAVINFPDGANILYDFNTNRQVVLPKTWQEFSFSADGDKFAFKVLNSNPDNRWLAVANSDGSEVRLFQPLGNNANKVTVSWSPTGQVVGWYTEAKDLQRQEMYFLGFNGENYKSMVVEGYNPVGKWSPSGGRLLYSTTELDQTNGYPPSLWVAEASGDVIGAATLKLSVNTWADKCIFADDKTIYCAVPRSLPFAAGFDRTKAIIGDDLYRIDLTTATKTPVAIFASRQYVINDLLLSEDGKTLYFVDQGSGNLQQISTVLPQ